ncbi:MAG: hypothetical protein IAE79_07680 [Anaerolinea sp.]|nr:hypothetical protein [Anaerolinea sp.]
MARDCLDEHGRLLLWPRPGGWHEQDEYEMMALRLAWYVRHLFNNPKNRTEADGPFLIWLDEEFDKPGEEELFSAMWLMEQ